MRDARRSVNTETDIELETSLRSAWSWMEELMTRSSTYVGSADTRIRFPRINAVLGMWLCVSAFLWRHAVVELVSTFAVGALTVLLAAASAYLNPNLRYVITGLAL